jgi:uncharacterized protein (TIGR03032 family)
VLAWPMESIASIGCKLVVLPAPALEENVENSTNPERSPEPENAEPARAAPTEGLVPTKEEVPLRSQHTASFPAILEQLGISLAFSTYQTGHLVLLRAQGAAVNTHFRRFHRPMGMSYRAGRLAIGTRAEICEFRDVPAVGLMLEPPGRHDACFLPRRVNVTGDIHVHDLAWVAPASAATWTDGKPEPELWFVNTAFSCLCSRTDNHSFHPRWQPRFITKYLPEDRCHLNGLGVHEGQVRWVTALGETDEPQGWRQNKRDGGILFDIIANEVITRGLSMPHSPRWHQGRLWILQSGLGSIGIIDPDTGRYDEVARFPGFTRGLAFCGPLAFVGLSQVRETAVFGGIPLVESSPERNCGVWALDTRTGRIVGFVRFLNALQEVFAVEALPCRFPDLINDDADILAKSYDLP